MPYYSVECRKYGTVLRTSMVRCCGAIFCFFIRNCCLFCTGIWLILCLQHPGVHQAAAALGSGSGGWLPSGIQVNCITVQCLGSNFFFYLSRDSDLDPDPGTQTNPDMNPDQTLAQQKDGYWHEKYMYSMVNLLVLGSGSAGSMRSKSMRIRIRNNKCIYVLLLHFMRNKIFRHIALLGEFKTIKTLCLNIFRILLSLIVVLFRIVSCKKILKIRVGPPLGQ